MSNKCPSVTIGLCLIILSLLSLNNCSCLFASNPGAISNRVNTNAVITKEIGRFGAKLILILLFAIGLYTILKFTKLQSVTISYPVTLKTNNTGVLLELHLFA